LKDVYEALGLVATELGVKQAELDALVDPPASAAPVDTTSWGSDAVTGALGAGATGAAIGTMILPGIGTAIGAAIGGIVGFIGGGLGDLFGWWDVGATNIPKDQMGTVHAGEAIIPKTFADGIRSGEMVLSGKGGSSAMDSGSVYVTVNVAGSVTTENDLASSIAKNIYTQRKRGLLTV
jgi:predicted RecA/RadA family phage recombinase